jgi:hypothetical protein
MRKVYLLGLAQLLISIAVLFFGEPPSPAAPEPAVTTSPFDSHDRAAVWYERAHRHCNAREALAHLRRVPAPDGLSGSAHAAACLALAGELDAARATLVRLPEDQRWRAAGVVFEVIGPSPEGHMEERAAPAMELVLEFWPDHWMALYYAGVARFDRGDRAGAAELLERFLAEYPSYDGWRAAAIRMLGKETE